MRPNSGEPAPRPSPGVAGPGGGGIFREIVRLQQAGRSCVLATPLWSEGSAPVSRQAKLLVRDDGSTLGTVGGGAMEHEVMRVALQALGASEPRLLEFDLSASEAAASGMICGGRCAILVEPVAADSNTEAFAAAARAEASGEPIALITLLRPDGPSQKVAVTPAMEVIGNPCPLIEEALASLAAEALADGRPRYRREPVEAHIDPLLPRPGLLVFGGGHIGVCLAHMAGIAGFRVILVDDREEFANRERFPTADEVVVASPEEAFKSVAIGPDSYVVSVTRGHLLDEEVVAGALATPARYIGMIGSKRKVAKVLSRLRQRGFSDQDLGRLHAPIGLDIGADTVEEIAVSILAELIAVRRRMELRILESRPQGVGGAS